MSCFVKRPSNDFNFMSWQVASDVKVVDLQGNIPDCTIITSAPTNPIIQAQTSGDIDLVWSYPQGDATSYEVHMSDFPNTGFSLLGTVIDSEATISGLGANVTKYFKVRALGSALSAFSPVVGATTFIDDSLSLDVLTLTGIVQTTIQVEWDYQLIQKETFLEWSTDETFATVDGSTTLPKGTNVFLVENLTANTEYFFRIQGTSMSNYYRINSLDAAVFIASQNNQVISNGNGAIIIQG